MKEKISIYGLLTNLVLTGLKIFAGIISGSVALIAEAIHSGLDIFSSFVAYLGIKFAKKPADEKHPYGYHQSETIAGFLVTLILIVSAFWIIYEGISQLSGEHGEVFSILGLVVIGISAILNEIMARLKFYWGNKENSLSLITDAEHSHADVWASVGVFVGLFLTKYWPIADGILAIFIGLYILYECIDLTKETVGGLLDIRDGDTEEKIKNLFKKLDTEITDIKSRKIGGYGSAEVKIILPKNYSLEQAQETINNLEKQAQEKIENLKHIVINFEAEGEEYIKQTSFGTFGRRFGQGVQKKGLAFEQKKQDIEKTKEKGIQKIVIPLQNGKQEIAKEFGADRYLLIETKNNKIIKKEIVKNQFADENSKYSLRFIKSIGATKIIANHIGQGAKANIEALGIDTQIINNEKLVNILESLKGGDK